jgi:hypothetical protein
MKGRRMKQDTLISVLKAVMVLGITLIILGIYLHMYEPRIEAMGVKGIIISAGCVAFGMVLSLPTKMFLTFILVKRETDIAKSKVEHYRRKV